MKKIIVLGLVVSGLASCSVETTENKSLEDAFNELSTSIEESSFVSTGDISKDEVLSVLSQVKKGLKPEIKISEIKAFDNKIVPDEYMGKLTGNFISDYNKGDYNIYKVYTKKFNEQDKLSYFSVTIGVLSEVYYNEETDEEDPAKKLNITSYVELIDKQLGVSHSSDGDYYTWEKDDLMYELSIYDDYTINLAIN